MQEPPLLSLCDTEPIFGVHHVALGVFDGVHLGHQSLIQHTRSLHPDQSLTALSFWPHPLTLVRPEQAPLLLCSLNQRVQSLLDSGAHQVLVLHFTDRLRRLTGLQFLHVLQNKFPDIASLCVGENFRFGFNRDGNADLLSHFEATQQVRCFRVPRLMDSDGTISSSRIRECIAQGFFHEASILLGRPWSFCGTVIPGDQLGRTLGFPTANLSPKGYCLPPHGVYQCQARVGTTFWNAVVNLGIRPTLQSQGELRLEAHLIDYAGNLYGQELVLTNWRHLRPEARFSSLSALQEQIAKDVTLCRQH